MKTVSILEYDHAGHQFNPSFVIQDDLRDNDTECAFDEVVICPSDEWMDEYLAWNRFGRLPDDPAEDNLLCLDEDDSATTSIPYFQNLQELHDFNAKGAELTRRLREELRLANNPSKCVIRVAPYRPLYTNISVGPVAAWWDLKDCNYNFVVPIQRLPVPDRIKSRLQAYRCHKGMSLSLWQDADFMHELVQEGQDLQHDVLLELHPPEGSPVSMEESGASSVGSSAVAINDGVACDAYRDDKEEIRDMMHQNKTNIFEQARGLQKALVLDTRGIRV